jgi:hypothetical protein
VRACSRRCVGVAGALLFAADWRLGVVVGASFASRGLVGFAGSRALPGSFSGLVRACVASVVRAGRGVAVGCASGADAFALAAAAGRCPVSVFAVGDRSGAGFWACSAPLSLLRSAGSGVVWLAGGPLSVPLSARLAARTAAFVSSVACRVPASGVAGSGCGLVAFFAAPRSGGSALACRLALMAGLPVLAFACGFPAAELPAVSRLGAWAPAGGVGPWASAFRWVPA